MESGKLVQQQVTKLQTGMEGAVQEGVRVLTTYGLDLIGALLILIFGLWLAGRVQRLTRSALEKTRRIDPTLTGFFSSAVKYLVLIVTGVAVLNQFGVQTTSLIAVLGAAGLAIGLALQGTLANVAAGAMLLIFRPFKVGDWVEVGGLAGSVRELNLFFTELATGDNVKIIIPNSQAWGTALKNFSANPTRRVDLLMGISYGDDIGQALEAARRAIAADPRILKDPEPLVAVSDLGESAVNLAVRVWVANGEYWPVRFDLTRAIKEGFDRAGITIPFPTRTLMMTKDSP